MPVLLPALLKMMWDVHSDQGSTPEPVKAALLQGATDCLILLDCCSEGRVKVSRDPTEIDPSCLRRASTECARASSVQQCLESTSA